MGLSVSILISAWREIFTQRFHTQLCDITFPSSCSSPRTMQLNLNIIRRGNSFKMIRSSSSSSSPSDQTDQNKTTTTTTAPATSSKGFKSAKPESIMVINKRALSIDDLIIQKHDHLPNTPPPPYNNKKILIEGSNGLIHEPLPAITLPSPAHEFVFNSPRPECVLEAAAVKLQKVYKSYRTRRNLADCAVVVEELWWKALDFAALKRSSISFFDCGKQETAVSKWARARTRVAKVGKGLSQNEKAQKLALRHWLEAIDPRHRYGHNLHLYYDIWFESESSQPYFYWLDIGDGKEVNLEKCPRTKLQHQCIQYLGPKERESYQVIVEDGKLTYKLSGELVNTEDGSKWIFVLSTARALYIGEKKKGSFQHSSFLAGAATTAAGRLVVHDGILEAIWPYSGHYLPTEENFNEFIEFLQENNVDLTHVKKYNYNDESVSVIDEVPFETEDDVRNSSNGRPQRLSSVHDTPAVDPWGEVAGVPPQGIKNNNKKPKPLSCKWTTGTGPRIGCVRDYPVNLQSQALEHVKLSPRVGSSEWPIPSGPIPSPRPSSKVRVSPRLCYMGLPSPRRN